VARERAVLVSIAEGDRSRLAELLRQLSTDIEASARD
jgi:hypothetical protein